MVLGFEGLWGDRTMITLGNLESHAFLRIVLNQEPVRRATPCKATRMHPIQHSPKLRSVTKPCSGFYPDQSLHETVVSLNRPLSALRP